VGVGKPREPPIKPCEGLSCMRFGFRFRGEPRVPRRATLLPRKKKCLTQKGRSTWDGGNSGVLTKDKMGDTGNDTEGSGNRKGKCFYKLEPKYRTGRMVSSPKGGVWRDRVSCKKLKIEGFPGYSRTTNTQESAARQVGGRAPK